MNRLNFNSLKNIHVPEEWIQNALKISQQKKKYAGAVTVRRIVTLAACLALVGILCIPAVVFERYKITIPVAPPVYINNVENSGMNSADRPYLFDPTEFSDSAEEKKTLESEKPTQLHTDPTETSGSVDKGPSEPVMGEPSPPVPTRSEPTTPFPTAPTKPPINTQDTQPNTGEYVAMVPTCAGSFLLDDMNIDSVGDFVYCRLYDIFGNLVGDPNLYSFEHIANEIYMPNGYIFVSYDPTEKGLNLKKGTYSFCFYTDKGKVVLEGNITVY